MIRESSRCAPNGWNRKIGWHFCVGNAWGTTFSREHIRGYQTVLPYFFETKGIASSCSTTPTRGLAGVVVLKSLPKNVACVRVLDIRTNAIDNPGIWVSHPQGVLRIRCRRRKFHSEHGTAA